MREGIDRRISHFLLLATALFPIALGLGAAIYFNGLDLDESPRSTVPAFVQYSQEVSSTIEANMLGGRLAWATTALLLTMLLVWHLLFSIFTIWQRVFKAPRTRTLLSLLPVVFAFWFALAQFPSVGARSWTGFVGNSLLQEFSRWETSSGSVLRQVLLVRGFNNAGSLLAIALAIGSCVVLLSPKRTTAAADIRRALHDYRISLYSSAALLSVGVLQIKALFGWANSLRPSPSVDISGSTVLAASLFFSALLFAMYIPTALGLEHRIEERANVERQKLEDFDQEAWRQDLGVRGSLLGGLQSYAAMLGPAAVGAVPKLLETL